MDIQRKSAAQQPLPVPDVDPIAQPFWEGLARGKLLFQRCNTCAHAWLPALAQCPNCLTSNIGWEPASGRAHLVSWVTYHVSFHPAFQDRLPYIVAIVALTEGPRMLTNLVDVASETELTIDAELSLVIDREDAVSIARFKPIQAGQVGAPK